MKTLDVFFTPADFAGLSQRNLDDTYCVVLDIFRATSTMVTALANGAAGVVPVTGISEALAMRQQDPAILLAGERDGLRITAGLTGGKDFDLGNSPHEFTREKISGRTLVMTTTNGTRALRACVHARRVLIGSFLNLKATADRISEERPNHLLIVCSGTFEQAAYEDVLAAGALCRRLGNQDPAVEISDSALMAQELFRLTGDDLFQAAAGSRNGRRLLARPELKDDVQFCLQRDLFNCVAGRDRDGSIKLI